MKILHLIGGELTGGAAKGALWLHNGLRDLGIESRILTNGKDTLGDPFISTTIDSKWQWISNALKSRLDPLPILLYPKRNTQAFSVGIFGYNFTRHPLFEWADLIHMHWINAAYVNVRHLSRIQKPLVWTMRDMWPVTGGCHVAMSCEKYKSACGACPQLGSSNESDLSRYIIKRKERHIPKDITLVGISHWISDCARNSYLFKDTDVLTISNNVSCKDFFPYDKVAARKALGIPLERKVILTGAERLDIRSKGFDLLVDALPALKQEDPLLLFFGNADAASLKDVNAEYKALGLLKDKESLRIAYSAADVFVSPTRMDAFGKTLAESMACGTPVVSFNATGPKDIVDHRVNGYLATPFESADLAAGIRWVFQHPDRELMSKLAIRKVAETFDTPIIADRYAKLYRRKLGLQG